MFHVFFFKILWSNVSRETLSCVIIESLYRMFHVKHYPKMLFFIAKTAACVLSATSSLSNICER